MEAGCQWLKDFADYLQVLKLTYVHLEKVVYTFVSSTD
jgi:hypothetical protein